MLPWGTVAWLSLTLQAPRLLLRLRCCSPCMIICQPLRDPVDHSSADLARQCRVFWRVSGRAVASVCCTTRPAAPQQTRRCSKVSMYACGVCVSAASSGESAGGPQPPPFAAAPALQDHSTASAIEQQQPNQMLIKERPEGRVVCMWAQWRFCVSASFGNLLSQQVRHCRPCAGCHQHDLLAAPHVIRQRAQLHRLVVR
jgi:hypothetical protein